MSTLIRNNSMMEKVFDLKEFLEELELFHGVEGFKVTEKSAKEKPDHETLLYGLELEIEETPKATYIMMKDKFEQIIENEVMSIMMLLPESIQSICIKKKQFTNALIVIEFISGSAVIIEATEDKIPDKLYEEVMSKN